MGGIPIFINGFSDKKNGDRPKTATDFYGDFFDKTLR
jgi:hypothetical protein